MRVPNQLVSFLASLHLQSCAGKGDQAGWEHEDQWHENEELLVSKLCVRLHPVLHHIWVVLVLRQCCAVNQFLCWHWVIHAVLSVLGLGSLLNICGLLHLSLPQQLINRLHNWVLCLHLVHHHCYNNELHSLLHHAHGLVALLLPHLPFLSHSLPLLHELCLWKLCDWLDHLQLWSQSMHHHTLYWSCGLLGVGFISVLGCPINIWSAQTSTLLFKEVSKENPLPQSHI